jgi:hypothetical protein
MITDLDTAKDRLLDHLPTDDAISQGEMFEPFEKRERRYVEMALADLVDEGAVGKRELVGGPVYWRKEGQS